MVFKISLKEEERGRIEYLRGVMGNFNKEVFFWDIVTKERFDCKGHAFEYANRNMDVFDLENIKIVEVCL